MRHFIEKMMAQRLPYYSQAQYTCSGDLLTGAQEIIQLLQNV